MKKKSVLQYLFIFLPSVAMLFVVCVLVYMFQSNNILSVIADKNKDKTFLSQQIINSHLKSLSSDALYIASQNDIGKFLQSGGEDADIKINSLSFSQYHPAYTEIRFINASGVEVLRIDRQNGAPTLIENLHQLGNDDDLIGVLRDLQSDQVFLSPFALEGVAENAEQEAQPILNVGTPVYRSGQFYGGVWLRYSGSEMLSALSNLGDADSHRVWLVNGEGHYIVGSRRHGKLEIPENERFENRFSTQYPEVWAVRNQTENSYHHRKYGAMHIATVPLQEYFPDDASRRWYVIAFTSQEYIREQNTRVFIKLAIFALIIAVLIAVGTAYFVRKTTDRARSTELLSSNEKQFRTLMQSAPDAIIVVDDDGVVRIVNQAAIDLLGYSHDELVGIAVERLMPEGYRSHHVKYRRDYTASPSVRPMGQSSELCAERKDGTQVPVEISLSPFDRGDSIWVTAIVRDVSGRREHLQKINALNSQLASRSTELEAINKELEAFSYSVSHDLRAPLRAIDGFSHTLAKLYADKLDEKGQHRLQRIRDAAQKMGQLIDDLLVLSRISRAEVKKDDVDLSELAQQIIDELQEGDPERDVHIRVAQNMTIFADRRLISVAVTNLLSNAWKFTSNEDSAEIEVGMGVQDDVTFYYIRDNGAGFNMEYAEKLFGAFQRLHDTTEFPGTGVGLATVQRVIHKHGGRVWAHSEEGHGATFYFSLGEDSDV